MTRLLFILLLAVGVSLGPSLAWAGEPFTAPDGMAYPDDVQAILTEAKAAYDAEDFPRAHALWLPLAEGGNAEAQYRVGRLYDVGEGFARNGPTAVEWYSRAERKGHTDAGFNLAVIFRRGEIVEANMKRAAALFKRLATAGDVEAQLQYGLHLTAGRGLEKDLLIGLEWIFRASNMGNEGAKTALMKLKELVPETLFIQAQKRSLEDTKLTILPR